jgi:5-methylcytosine-specific restriction endonuclease McrA
MIALGAPSATEDENYLLKICKQSPWPSHHGVWLQCYQLYRSHGGNPWNIAGSQFPVSIGKEQRQLYESRKSVKRFTDIRNQQLASCPMCGSPATGTLDHFLSKDTFPEFSVMAANLVPACTHCNSSAKGRKYQGADLDEWPLHPYFDTLAQSAIWRVRIIPPYQAATFEAVPYSNHPPAVHKRLAFHLKFVLGLQFIRSCTNLWATLPQVIRDVTDKNTPVSVMDVSSTLALRLKINQASLGMNAWQTAFHRGLLGDLSAHIYLASQASILAKS